MKFCHFLSQSSKTFDIIANNDSLLGKLFTMHLLLIGDEKRKNDEIAFFYLNDYNTIQIAEMYELRVSSG